MNAARLMAIDCFESCFKHYLDPNHHERELRWIEDESRHPFGFFWALHYARVSPPLVREHIEKLEDVYESTPIRKCEKCDRFVNPTVKRREEHCLCDEHYQKLNWRKSSRKRYKKKEKR